MKNILKNIKKIWNKLNKKTVLIGLAIIVILIIVIMLINIFGNSKTTLKCSREQTMVDFYIKEELIVKTKKDLISSLSVDKTIEIGDDYNKFETYHEVILNSVTSAYEYLDKKSVKVKQEDNVTQVKASVKEKGGLILDNIKIFTNSDTNKYDLTFNVSKELESSTTTYKIGDKYTKKELKNKLEGLGYTCK